MQWPNIDQISVMAPLPEGYRYALMTPADIASVMDAIRTWFPSVTVGLGSLYLNDQFYLDNVVMENDTDKSILLLLIKKADELVGFGSWERESAALTLFARLGAIAPAHRGAKMAVIAMELGEKMGRAMGAGFIYTLATLKMPQMQHALERAGYQLIGFMPGYDREETSPGVVSRVFEAGYAKRLAPAEEFLQPDDKNFTPNVKRLFDIIFPPESR